MLWSCIVVEWYVEYLIPVTQAAPDKSGNKKEVDSSGTRTRKQYWI